MRKKQIEANEKYLSENDVYIPDGAVYDEYPHSRELFKRTQVGGDMFITVEVLDKEHVLQALCDFDVNNETVLWWGGKGVPFDNIKDLYDDIEQWRDDFVEIAEGMPY